jgi:hypothetical protein
MNRTNKTSTPTKSMILREQRAKNTILAQKIEENKKKKSTKKSIYQGNMPIFSKKDAK